MPSLRRLAWTAPVLLVLVVSLAQAAVPTAPAEGADLTVDPYHHLRIRP